MPRLFPGKLAFGGYLKIPWTKVAVKECHFLPPKNKSHDGEIFQCGKFEFLLETFWRDTRQTLRKKHKLFQTSQKTTWVSKNAVFLSSSFTDPTQPVECEQENEGDMKNKSKSWLTSGELCIYIYIHHIYVWYVYHDMIYTYTLYRYLYIV